jgi:hypothetical protein
MLINELVGVKKFKDMTATDVLQLLSKNYTSFKDVKLLGQGSNGAAVKIKNDVWKFWMVDSAYEEYVRYCQHNEGNKFLPKFLSNIKKIPAFFIRHEDAPKYVKCIKVEELEPLGYANDVKFKLNTGKFITLEHVINAADKLTDSEVGDNFRYATALSAGADRKIEATDLSQDLILLMKTLDEIRNLNHFLDLHGGNFMYRDKQLVILDPIANHDDLYINTNFTKFDMRRPENRNNAQPAFSSKDVNQREGE